MCNEFSRLFAASDSAEKGWPRKGDRLPVLVTGGAGYIGSHAVLALLDAGWPVVVIDNLSTGFDWAVPEGALFVRGRHRRRRPCVARLIAEHGIGAIMHFAGSVVVPESVADPLKYYENNTVKSRALIESAVERRRAAFHLLLDRRDLRHPRDACRSPRTRRPQPINPYGWSKLMTERMLTDSAAAHPLNYCALRYFNVAGADPQGRSGQSTAGATHLIKVAVEAATGKRGHVDVYGTDYDTPDGTGVRDYIHVSDLAAAHVHALERLIAAPEREPHAQLRLRPRLFGARGARQRRPRHQPHDRAPAGAAPRRRSARAGRRQSARSSPPCPGGPQRDDLDTIVADALAWERRLAERG